MAETPKVNDMLVRLSILRQRVSSMPSMEMDPLEVEREPMKSKYSLLKAS